MAPVALIVTSVMIGIGPVLLWLTAILFKVPQLFLIALLSAGAYYLTSYLLLSVLYVAIGASHFSSATPFFAPFSAVVTELVRYKLCHLILAAEDYFQTKGQTLVAFGPGLSVHKRLAAFGTSIGLGMALVYGCLTVGTAANAEGTLTWINRGSSTGEWMPVAVESATWIDLDSCPQMPKLTFVSLQSFLVSWLHIFWSVWMMLAVDAIRRHRRLLAPSNAERVPLTPSAQRTAMNSAQDVELSDAAAGASTTSGAASPLATAAADAQRWLVEEALGRARPAAYVLVACVVILHVTLRVVSLSGSDAAAWDAASRQWTISETDGCQVILIMQGVWLVLTAGASLVIWKRVSTRVVLLQ